MRTTKETQAHKQQRLKEEADAQQKIQDIVDNLPSWQQVSDAVDNISNLNQAKIFIKKLARVVYWLAKNKSD